MWLLTYFTGRCWRVGLFAASPLQQCLSFACYLLWFALPQAPPVLEGWGWVSFREAGGFPWQICFYSLGHVLGFPQTFGDGACCKEPGSSANSVKPLAFERAGMGKKKKVFCLRQKSISQIQYLCNEEYCGGNCASLRGAALAGKAVSGQNALSPNNSLAGCLGQGTGASKIKSSG